MLNYHLIFLQARQSDFCLLSVYASWRRGSESLHCGHCHSVRAIVCTVLCVVLCSMFQYSPLYSIVQHSKYNIVQLNTVQYSEVQRSTVGAVQ